MPVVSRLDATFARLRCQGELGLFPFITTGFPDPAMSRVILRAVVEAGADGVEIGLPFSDPLADGVTLQRAGARALEHGVSVADALALVRDLRGYSEAPALMMSYFNPLLAYGLGSLAQDGADAGLDGFIVPDLPLEEADGLRRVGAASGLAYVYLVAPTTTDARLEQVATRASGFVYCVTLLGTTGAREQLPPELPAFLKRVRSKVSCPLLAGFGISRPDHIAGLHGLADGVIVGGALADIVERSHPDDLIRNVRRFIQELKTACRSSASVPH
jgi:tryptophan synthase alpha chain